MAFTDITREAVLAAMVEYDQVGNSAFLEKYGFGPARNYFVEADGRRYDSKAIVGAAHGFLGAGARPLGAGDFSGGDATVVPVLERLGFAVVRVADGDQAPASVRNPTWTRDELILALDLYLTNPVSPPGKTSRAVIELSDVLNRLGVQLGREAAGTYRNPNGVYMKMMNFRRFDPSVIASGKVGLQRGGKDEEEVWNEFANDRTRLVAVSAIIRATTALPAAEQPPPYDEDDVMEAEEGRILTRLHRTRERSRKLVEQRKRQALTTTGALKCEACGFDFAQTYGARGTGFIEIHHTKPLPTLDAGSKTKLEDLALVCANCHRMIHATRHWLTVEEVRVALARPHG